jgi:hypothetical protein
VSDPNLPREPDEGEDVRRLLQGLPEVDPPEGFYEHLIRRKRNRARAVVVLGLIAAAVGGAIVVAEATGVTGEVEPTMVDLVSRHEDMMEDDGQADGESPADVGAPYQVPDRIGPFSPGMAVRHPDDVVQVVYGLDGDYLSVFEQAGDLDEDALGGNFTRLHLRGVRAWESEDGETIVVRRSDVVYVLVGDIDHDAIPELIEDLPDARPMGVWERARDAMDDLVDTFGFS